MRISDWSSDVCSSDLYIKQTKIFRSAAIRGVRLHIDALHPPAIYEIVDVCAAPGGADGVVHVRLRQSTRPGQPLIALNLELSNILLSKDANTAQLWTLCRCTQQLVQLGRALEGSQVIFDLNAKSQPRINPT